MSALRSVTMPVAVLALALPGMARAENGPGFFGQTTLSDDLLASQRAGFAVMPLSLAYRLRLTIDSQTRSTERLTAGVSRIAMDIWWDSVGSEMIAANVRASAATP